MQQIKSLQEKGSKIYSLLNSLDFVIDGEADQAQLGGIDLNEIEVDRQGVGVNIQFDPAAMEPILNMQIDGFAPVIINFVPINSVLPLLGLEPQREEELEMSSLN